MPKVDILIKSKKNIYFAFNLFLNEWVGGKKGLDNKTGDNFQKELRTFREKQMINSLRLVFITQKT